MPRQRSILTSLVALAAIAASLLPLGGGAPAAASIRYADAIGTTDSYRPLANGDEFNYNVVSETTTTQHGKTSHSTQKSTQTEKVAYPVKHGGKAGLYALTSTSTYASGPTATDVTYVRLAKQGSFQLEEILAETYSEVEGSVSISETETYKQPSIIDELPEAKGLSWTEAAPFGYTFSYVVPGFTETENGDQDALGGYTEQDKTVAGSSTTTAAYDLKDDGSGTLAMNPGGTYSFGLPVKQGGSYVIPVVYQSATTDVPDWYPGGGEPLQPLETLPAAIGGFVKTPKGCGAQAGMTAYDIRVVQTELDPISGEYVTGTSDAYDVAGKGTVCGIAVTSFKGYDNFTTGKLTSKSTTTYTEILTSEIVKARTRFGVAEPFNSLPNHAWMRRALERSAATAH
jgi:hypothetical protein